MMSCDVMSRQMMSVYFPSFISPYLAIGLLFCTASYCSVAFCHSGDNVFIGSRSPGLIILYIIILANKHVVVPTATCVLRGNRLRYRRNHVRLNAASSANDSSRAARICESDNLK